MILINAQSWQEELAVAVAPAPLKARYFNEDLFYPGMVSEGSKGWLYDDINLVSIVTQLRRISKGELSIARVAKKQDVAGALTKSITVYLVNKTGIVVCMVGVDNEGKYSISNRVHTWKQRGKDRKKFDSIKPERIVSQVKKTRLSALVEYYKDDPSGEYSLTRCFAEYVRKLGIDEDYSGVLDGEEVFLLLKNYNNALHDADIPDRVRARFKSTYENYLEQEGKNTAIHTDVKEAFCKEAWAIQVSKLGIQVGTFKISFTTKTLHSPEFTSVMEPRLYKNMDALPESIKDSLMITLLMCKTNREAGGYTYQYEDYDTYKFFPKGDHAWSTTQSATWSAESSPRIFFPQYFIVPK